MSWTLATIGLVPGDVITIKKQPSGRRWSVFVGDAQIHGEAQELNALAVAILKALSAPGEAQGRSMGGFTLQEKA